MAHENEPATLPLEVLDLILDHLHTDRAALSACSLVCKSWLSRSRYHLMADHVINAHDTRPKPPLYHSVLSRYTRNLLLNHINAFTLWPEEAQFYASITTLYVAFASISSTLQSLISSTFTLVTHLELRTVFFDTSGDLVQMVCSFPMLESLKLVACRWVHETEVASAFCLRPSRSWRSLSIEPMTSTLYLTSFLGWFASLKPIPQLNTFRTLQLDPNSDVTKNIITSLGHSLERLTIGSHNVMDINLRNNPNLRDLELLFCTSPQLLINILESYKPHSELKEISLGTNAWGDISLWPDLDRLLVDLHNKTGFKKLKHRVQAINPVSKLRDTTSISALLPESTALGIVQSLPERDVRNERIQGLVGLECLGVGDVFPAR